MQAVEEIEGERDRDQADQDRQAEKRIHVSQMIGDEGVDLVRDVLEAIDHLLQVIVEVGLDDEIHRALARRP